MEINKNWKVITHLVHVTLDNVDGVEWGLRFGRYVNEERKKSVQGGSIGYLDKDGIIKPYNPSKYKVLITKDKSEVSYRKGTGNMIWLENLDSDD